MGSTDQQRIIERTIATGTLTGLDPQRSKLCMLVLTHSCNLNCTYCYEKFKSSKKMDFVTGVQSLKEQLNFVRSSSNHDWLLVDLFGGEPLLNFTLIQQVVEWAKQNVTDIPVRFMISSNGSILTDKMKQWFSENKKIIFLGISYDGSEKRQIQNRGKNNWEALIFCKKTWPKLPFRITVSPDSIENLADDIINSLNEGYHIVAEFAGGVEWPINLRELLLNELRKLRDAALENVSLDVPLINRFFKGGEDMDIIGAVACGSGSRCTCYDIDGTKYPCQMFTPLTVGERAIQLENFHIEKEENRNDPKCKGCIIKHWCPSCYGMNYYARGHTSSRDHSMCHVYLTQALVTAEFQMMKIMQEPLNADKAALLKFLLRISKEIKTKLNIP